MESQECDIKVFSARQALVDLKSKLAVASITKTEVRLSGLEARMVLALLDERTPWTL